MKKYFALVAVIGILPSIALASTKNNFYDCDAVANQVQLHYDATEHACLVETVATGAENKQDKVVYMYGEKLAGVKKANCALVTTGTKVQGTMFGAASPTGFVCQFHLKGNPQPFIMNSNAQTFLGDKCWYTHSGASNNRLECTPYTG